MTLLWEQRAKTALSALCPNIQSWATCEIGPERTLPRHHQVASHLLPGFCILARPVRGEQAT